MPGKKTSSATIQLKVNQILGLMIKGITRSEDILQYISKMDKLSIRKRNKINWIPIEKDERMIREYIRRAKEMLKTQTLDDIKEIKELYLARLDDCYKEAREKGLIQTANSIMKTQTYIQGLGSLGLRGSFDMRNYDVKLSPEEEKQVKDKMTSFFGESILEEDLDKEKK